MRDAMLQDEQATMSSVRPRKGRRGAELELPARWGSAQERRLDSHVGAMMLMKRRRSTADWCGCATYGYGMVCIQTYLPLTPPRASRISARAAPRPARKPPEKIKDRATRPTGALPSKGCLHITHPHTSFVTSHTSSRLGHSQRTVYFVHGQRCKHCRYVFNYCHCWRCQDS